MSEDETSPSIDISTATTPDLASAESATHLVDDTNHTSPTVSSEKSSPTSDGSTSDDEEDTEDPSIKEAEIKRSLDEEVAQVGDTLENRTTNDFVEKLAGTDPAHREQFARDNRGKQALRTRHLVKTLSKLEDGKIHRISTDPSGATSHYRTEDGKGIIGIIQIDTTSDVVMCRIEGAIGSNDISMSRAELLDLMYQTDKTLILESYPLEDRPLMEKYYAGLSGKEKEDGHYQALPELITKTAEAHDIPTTRRLFKALESRYTSTPIPADASPEDTARITADNVQKAVLIAEIETKLEGNNLANADQLKMTMDLLGITPKNLTTILETTRIQSEQLRKAIESEQDAGKKAEYKTQLDTIDATAQIYQEIQGMLAADPEGKYAEKFLESQRAGNVSAELAKSIAESLDKGEIETLIHMVSPEASITATAEEKRKFREAREKQTKILKGLGLAAALAALLLALGISQGAKQ